MFALDFQFPQCRCHPLDGTFIIGRLSPNGDAFLFALLEAKHVRRVLSCGVPCVMVDHLYREEPTRSFQPVRNLRKSCRPLFREFGNVSLRGRDSGVESFSRSASNILKVCSFGIWTSSTLSKMPLSAGFSYLSLMLDRYTGTHRYFERSLVYCSPC